MQNEYDFAHVQKSMRFANNKYKSSAGYLNTDKELKKSNRVKKSSVPYGDFTLMWKSLCSTVIFSDITFFM